MGDRMFGNFSGPVISQFLTTVPLTLTSKNAHTPSLDTFGPAGGPTFAEFERLGDILFWNRIAEHTYACAEKRPEAGSEASLHM